MRLPVSRLAVAMTAALRASFYFLETASKANARATRMQNE
jgi:hypothetical protein